MKLMKDISEHYFRILLLPTYAPLNELNASACSLSEAALCVYAYSTYIAGRPNFCPLS